MELSEKLYKLYLKSIKNVTNKKQFNIKDKIWNCEISQDGEKFNISMRKNVNSLDEVFYILKFQDIEVEISTEIYSDILVNINNKLSELHELDTKDSEKRKQELVVDKLLNIMGEDGVENENVTENEDFTKDVIEDYLKNNFTSKRNDLNYITKFIGEEIIIFHNLKEQSISVSDLNGKVLHFFSDENYKLNVIDNILKDYIFDINKNTEAADINQLISKYGFNESVKRDDFWIYKNPKIKHRFIVHSENDKSVAIINNKNDIIIDNGNPMVYENEDYNVKNIESVIIKIMGNLNE